MLEAQAIEVSPDEPAVWYAEMNAKGRRIQIIKVVRNDRLAEYRADLGPEWAFTGEQEQIVAGQIWTSPRTGRIKKIESWHTVGECVEMGERNRHSRPLNEIYGFFEPKTGKEILDKYYESLERKK